MNSGNKIKMRSRSIRIAMYALILLLLGKSTMQNEYISPRLMDLGLEPVTIPCTSSFIVKLPSGPMAHRWDSVSHLASLRNLWTIYTAA
jgi:hypothetical protein